MRLIIAAVTSLGAAAPYSVLGSAAERDSAGKALERAAPYLRALLKKKVTIKTIPNLKFAYDETPQKASRIDALIHKLEKERGQR